MFDNIYNWQFGLAGIIGAALFFAGLGCNALLKLLWNLVFSKKKED